MTEETQALISALAGRIAGRIAPQCPNCAGVGWYAIPNYRTEEQEQEQCQWCSMIADYITTELTEVAEALEASQAVIDNPAPPRARTAELARHGHAVKRLEASLAKLREKS